MYISISFPQDFGQFNRLRRDNYPFNLLFTKYLAEVCRLGLKTGMDVAGLIGWIEESAFEGRRVPDIPEAGDGEGKEGSVVRFKTDDPDISAYIEKNRTEGNIPNKTTVMFLTRMTLRLSAEYGTSLFRLTRLIQDLSGDGPIPARKRQSRRAAEKPMAVRHMETAEGSPMETAEDTAAIQEPSGEKPAAIEKLPVEEEKPAGMPRISSGKATGAVPAAAAAPAGKSAKDSASAAMAALGELQNLASQAGEVVTTNPALADFM